jgi:protein O-GlcNAc transferase
MRPRIGRRVFLWLAFGMLLLIGAGWYFLNAPSKQPRSSEIRYAGAPVQVTPPDPPDPFVVDLHWQVNHRGPAVVLAEYRKRAAGHPKDADAQAALGVLYFVSNRHDRALRALEKAAALGARQGVVYHLLGSYHRDRGDLDEAAEEFQRETALTPDNPWAFYHLGLTLLQLDEVPDAIAAFTRSTQLAPNFADAYLRLGNTWFRKNDLRAAEQNLQRCVELDPGNVQGWIGIAHVKISTGNPDEADRILRHALSLQPDAAEIHNDLGKLYLLRPQTEANTEAALKYLQRALERNPSDGEIHYGLGQAYQRKGQLEQAAQELRHAVDLDPQDVQYRNLLVAILIRLGRRQEADEYLRTAPNAELATQRLGWLARAHIEPANPVIRYKLGCVLLKMKRYREAMHQFRALARLEPHGSRAYRQLARTYEAMGDHRRAVEAQAAAAKRTR